MKDHARKNWITEYAAARRAGMPLPAPPVRRRNQPRNPSEREKRVGGSPRGGGVATSWEDKRVPSGVPETRFFRVADRERQR